MEEEESQGEEFGLKRNFPSDLQEEVVVVIWSRSEVKLRQAREFYCWGGDLASAREFVRRCNESSMPFKYVLCVES